MKRLALGILAAPLLVQAVYGASPAVSQGAKPSACTPSPIVLHASPAPVPKLTSQQVATATSIINAARQLKVPERGQTIAVMTSLEESSLGSATAAGARGVGHFWRERSTEPDPTASAQAFYRSLTGVKGWQNLPPTLAAHAAEGNLDPEVFARSWPQAVTVVNALTTGTGLAGLRNLAARAQAVADCTAATVRGRFAVSIDSPYVGPFAPAVLDSRALDLAQHSGSIWFERCQAFVAILDGRPYSGYSTALDAWQTFEAEGVAHPVTGADGVAPAIGAWLYYRDSTNPAGHVATYLGNGQIASTDVFARGQVGIGPASAITNGPWYMQYLGWAPPWGAA